MNIKNIIYSRTFHFGDSNFEKVGLEIELTETDNVDSAFTLAKKTVEENRTSDIEIAELARKQFQEPVIQRRKDPSLLTASPDDRVKYNNAVNSGDERTVTAMECMYTKKSLTDAS